LTFPAREVAFYVYTYRREYMLEDPHIEALLAKHRKLEEAIAEEITRPHPDDVKLHEMKREKLKLKDEIAGHDAY
jgi:hypothetical protein